MEIASFTKAMRRMKAVLRSRFCMGIGALFACAWLGSGEPPSGTLRRRPFFYGCGNGAFFMVSAGLNQTVGSSATRALDVMFYAIGVYGWDVLSFDPEIPRQGLPDEIKNASKHELQWMLVEILMRL